MKKEFIDENGVKTIVITSTYSESQKRATQKYRDNNKDKVNQQRKQYYLNRKEKDPNFLVYKRNKAKLYYYKKKLLKQIKNESDNSITDNYEKNDEGELIKIREDDNIKPEPKVIEHPLLDETKEEKKKRIYRKKN